MQDAQAQARLERMIENARFGEVVIGITGPLLLSDSESAHVAEQAGRQLQQLMEEAKAPRAVRLITGLAPDAELLVAETLIEHCARLELPCTLTAAIVDSPQELLQNWLGRLEAQGHRAEPARVKAAGKRLKGILKQADQQLRYTTPDDAPRRGHQQLAALLAESCDILVAVMRARPAPPTGGAEETLRWWRDSEQIPANLRTRLQRPPHELRRLIRIDPDEAVVAPVDELRLALDEIHEHLRVGNALTANDIAHRALQSHPDEGELRYLYLLSLAQSGSLRRALRRYLELAPRAEEEDADWLALRGRLYKDLAFSGQDERANLQRAAQYYEQAFVRFGSTFGGVNAAVTHALSGERDAAHRLARQVCELSSGLLPGEPRARYFHHVCLAEALAVLGDWAGCRMALASADPFLREDLTTRARTRAQLRRVALAQGADPKIAETLAMPAVYLLQADAASQPAPLPEMLAERLHEAPVYAASAPEPLTRDLVRNGMRLYLVAAPGEELPAIPLERATRLAGFHVDEIAWFSGCARRHVQGLAELNARQLQVGVQALSLIDGAPPQWRVVAPSRPPQPKPPRRRRMVGLLFTDLVGFSEYSDADIARYWDEVMPALARVIRRHGRRVLLKHTWGDAIHLVTRDARSAAQISLELLACVRQLRELFSSVRLEMRVGAHFAPATEGRDAIERAATYFGSQLALTARVEPVTPPGTTYVTEEFAAELSLVAPEEFRLEYAGEVPLAKNFGAFRLYSLQPRQAAFE